MFTFTVPTVIELAGVLCCGSFANDDTFVADGDYDLFADAVKCSDHSSVDLLTTQLEGELNDSKPVKTDNCCCYIDNLHC